MFTIRDDRAAIDVAAKTEGRAVTQLKVVHRSWRADAFIKIVEEWGTEQLALPSEDARQFGEPPSVQRSLDEEVLEALRCIQPFEVG